MMHTFKPKPFRSFLSKSPQSPNPLKNDLVQKYDIPFRGINNRHVSKEQYSDRTIRSARVLIRHNTNNHKEVEK